MRERDLLEMASRVLWRCVVLGIILVLIWYVLAIFPDGFLWTSQQHLLGLTSHECSLVNYAGIAVAKLLIYIFFLVPWIAIRLVLLKQS